MSELSNARAAVTFQLPETKFQPGDLIQSRKNWQPGSSQSNFQSYLETAAKGSAESFGEKNRKIWEDRPFDGDQKLTRHQELQDDSAAYDRRVDRKKPDRNSSSARMNQSRETSEKAGTSGKAPDQPESDGAASKPEDFQTVANVTNQAVASVNPELQQQGNTVAELVSGEGTPVAGVAASKAGESGLNPAASAMAEAQADPDTQSKAAPLSGQQQVQHLQGTVADQKPAILAGDSLAPAVQTAAAAAVAESGTLLTGNATGKTEHNSQKPVIVGDTSVNTKENTATPLESLNSAVLKAFQNKAAAGADTQNAPHNQDELQQNLQNAAVAGKAGAVSGEGKPLNMAVLQTQSVIGENPDKSQMIPGMQLQQHQTASGQLQEMAATGAQAAGKGHLFAQIVENAKLMLAGSHSEMEINLKPEHLGKLQLKIAVENQVVTARFVAESQQVKGIIETNLNQLRDHLRESGLQIENVTVSVGTGTYEQNYNQAANSQGEAGAFKDSNGLSGAQGDSGVREEAAPTPKSLQETVIDLIA